MTTALARPPDPSLRDRRDRERKLALQKTGHSANRTPAGPPPLRYMRTTQRRASLAPGGQFWAPIRGHDSMPIDIHGNAKTTKKPTPCWLISPCQKRPTTPTFAPFSTPFSGNAPIAQAIGRMDRLRRAHGETSFTAAQVTEFVRDSVRSRSRLGFRRQHGHLVMTIQRAKNREFPSVIVLWPHTATGSEEHLRRLLYNGITRRAQSHCNRDCTRSESYERATVRARARARSMTVFCPDLVPRRFYSI